jgi:phage terminase small subunit
MAQMKQEWIIFVEEYMKTNGDIGKAYATAYCKDFTNKKQFNACQKAGSRLLKKDEIQEMIKNRNEDLKSANIADMREIQELLTGIARSVKDGSGNIILNPKHLEASVKAIDTLAKVQGLYEKRTSEKIDINVSLDGTDVKEFKP